MENQTFMELWRSLDTVEKDDLAKALSGKCNVAVKTPSDWGYGRRTPKISSQKIIVKHLKTLGYETDCKTLFPN